MVLFMIFYYSNVRCSARACVGCVFRRIAQRVARHASARIGHCTVHPLARLLRTIVVHVLLILLPRLVRICVGGALFLCTQVDGAYRSNDLFRFSTR